VILLINEGRGVESGGMSCASHCYPSLALKLRCNRGHNLLCVASVVNVCTCIF
jgi:hypothetical protein